MMTGFPKLTLVETKLLLRDPGSIFTLIVPLFILLVFSSTSSPGDTVLPTMTLTIAIGLVGLYMVPTTLATYRERGILRRLSTTPVRPVTMLTVQLVLQTAFAAVAAALLMGMALAFLGATAPARPAQFLLTFVLGVASVFSIGLVIAALAPSGRVANGVGVLLYFPLAFLGGLMQPKEMMPAVLARIGEFTPLGAFRQAVHDAWAGAAAQPLLICVMAGYALAVGAVAARLFRWE
ncbi:MULTISPECIES: ABC transporter permease [Streptosporangium]|uniref:ABC-2 type transport system permease protein n=1 Tax=Streptosporangium brasiliense TaxID=47480 RepID=A0ABT9QWG8_9ACTN|nr:ABC transporter permease [Streptosporangium brasiliense]MDP9861324.1 ABC-2 type transport system permease protein [Streptosporangium brasiliense]